jgi:hypothetical protein
MEDTTNRYKILFGKCEGDSIIEIHAIRWNDNIKINFGKMG